MPNIDLSILNQRQTPAFFADTLANRPAAGFLGRIFVSTDTYAFYRDNGTGWNLIGGPGTGTITGSGLNGQIALWTGASTIGGISGITYGLADSSITASKFIVTGGTSSQFLKGNGTLDSNTYNTGSGAVNQVAFFNGANSITGENNLWWDSVNNHFGINTNTPGTALDIHQDQSTLVQLNQTTATNDTRIAFQNSGTSLWRIGNFYNAGANDYGIFDVVGAAQPFTIKKTTGQTFIGAETTTSGRLVVNNSTGDNHIVVIGATAPSIRINNSGSGATKLIGIGLATATNNFIQGAVDRDMTIFNGSTTASPILFGIYDTTNIQEAARISASRNFIVGKNTDSGERLQISGTALITSSVTSNNKFESIFSNTNTIFDANSYLRLVNIGTSTLNQSIDLVMRWQDGTYNGTGGISMVRESATQRSGKLVFQPIDSSGNNLTSLSLASTGAATFSNNVYLGGATSPVGSRNELRLNGNNVGSAITMGRNGNNVAILQVDSGDNLFFENTANTYTSFSTNNTERLKIFANGNILAGTGADSGQKLQVNGNTFINGNLGISQGTATNKIDVLTANKTSVLGTTSAINVDYTSANINEFQTIGFSYSSSVGNTNQYWGMGFSAKNFGSALGDLFFFTQGTIKFTIKSSGILNITSIPTSAAGLSSGDIWSNLGILNIVP